MNIQQLRIVREAIRHRFNLTEVGKALFTSQSGVSKSLKDLEDELGVELFERSGKRLVGLSPAGQATQEVVQRILLDIQSLQKIAAQYAQSAKGNLVLATTHAQARYALPNYLKRFALDFPDVHLTLHQASPDEISQLLLEGGADIGIATEGLHQAEGLVTFPWYEWQHAIVAHKDHPIMQRQHITLHDLAEFPLITYHAGLTGRSRVDSAFQRAEVEPDIVLTALDADVIKTYVELGLGVGILADMAFNPERDQSLAMVKAGYLFGTNTTRLALRRDHVLRDFAYEFIARLAPELNRDTIRSQQQSAAPLLFQTSA